MDAEIEAKPYGFGSIAYMLHYGMFFEARRRRYEVQPTYKAITRLGNLLRMKMMKLKNQEY